MSARVQPSENNIKRITTWSLPVIALPTFLLSLSLGLQLMPLLLAILISMAMAFFFGAGLHAAAPPAYNRKGKVLSTVSLLGLGAVMTSGFLFILSFSHAIADEWNLAALGLGILGSILFVGSGIWRTAPHHSPQREQG